MFPTEKFQPVQNIEWFEYGKHVQGTDAELCEKLVGYVFEDVPALADFDVSKWEAYDYDGQTAHVEMTCSLDDGYSLWVRFGYDPGETDYFWGQLFDTEGSVADELEWGKLEQFSEWVGKHVGESQQMRLF